MRTFAPAPSNASADTAERSRPQKIPWRAMTMNSETLELKRKRDALHSLWRQLEAEVDKLQESSLQVYNEYNKVDKSYWDAFNAEPTFKEKERTEK
jgi:Ribonuclease G/E